MDDWLATICILCAQSHLQLDFHLSSEISFVLMYRLKANCKLSWTTLSFSRFSPRLTCLENTFFPLTSKIYFLGLQNHVHIS